MAYAQQSRYGALTGPSHPNHQLSYESSRGNHAAKTGYDSRSQVAGPQVSSRRGLPQEHQNSNEPPIGTYGFNEDTSDQSHFYDGGNGRYGGRGQNGAERWPPQQRPQGRPIEAGLHLHNDPRNRGPLSSRGRGRYNQQDSYYQPDQYCEPQSNERHYQAGETYHNGSQMHQDGEYGYDDFALQKPDSWTPTQHFNRPYYSDDQAYQDLEHSAGYPLQDREVSYDSRASEASAFRSKYEQPNSSRPQHIQQLKPCKSDKV